MTTKLDMGRVGLWQWVLDQQPSGRVRDLVAEIEQMGWPTLWRPEISGRDTFVSAGVILEATTTLKVAAGVAQIHARDPMAMAAAHKTVHEAYDGRFLLGLGVSHAPMIEGMRKQTYDKPLSFMRTYLEQMRSAPFNAVGPTEDLPIVLGALGPKMLELAATAADGAHTYFSPPEHTATARDIMGPDAFLAAELMVLLDNDPASARQLARDSMNLYLGLPNYANNLRRLGWLEEDIAGPSDNLVDAIVAWGDEDDIAARVKAHHDAGADHVCVQHLFTDPKTPPVEQWHRLADCLL